MAFAKIGVEKRKGEYEGFHKLEGELAAKGSSNPDALAAWIGRKKYGKKKLQEMALAARKQKGK